MKDFEFIDTLDAVIEGSLQQIECLRVDFEQPHFLPATYFRTTNCSDTLAITVDICVLHRSYVLKVTSRYSLRF